MSLDKFFKKWDARYGIPRHANSLHLDSYQAGLRLARDIGEGAAVIAASLLFCLIWWKIGDMFLSVGIDIRLHLPFVYLGIAFICAFDLARIALPYYRLTQPVTHGSARWAEVRTLKGEGLAFDNREPLPAGALRLGRGRGALQDRTLDPLRPCGKHRAQDKR